MKDLYEILGVAPGASPIVIKAAYRRLAKQHHPDAGGDRALFEEIQRAYDILSDPEKRRRYDETGDIGSPAEANPDAAAIEMLSRIIDMMLDSHSDWTRDFLTELRRGLGMMKTSANGEIRTVEKRRAAADGVLTRIQREPDAGSVIEAMLTRQIEAMDSQIEGGRQHIATLTRCEELVAGYSLTPDQASDVLTLKKLEDMIDRAGATAARPRSPFARGGWF